jgi:hypothetical protein
LVESSVDQKQARAGKAAPFQENSGSFINFIKSFGKKQLDGHRDFGRLILSP